MGTAPGLLRAPTGQEGLGGLPGGDPVPLSPALAPQTCSGQDYKRCLIRRDEDGNFWLSGVARRFCSLRELLGTYGRCGLQAEGARMHLAACCPPLPKGDTAAPGRGPGRGCAPEGHTSGGVTSQNSCVTSQSGLCEVTEQAMSS